MKWPCEERQKHSRWNDSLSITYVLQSVWEWNHALMNNKTRRQWNKFDIDNIQAATRMKWKCEGRYHVPMTYTLQWGIRSWADLWQNDSTLSKYFAVDDAPSAIGMSNQMISADEWRTPCINGIRMIRVIRCRWVTNCNAGWVDGWKRIFDVLAAIHVTNDWYQLKIRYWHTHWNRIEQPLAKFTPSMTYKQSEQASNGHVIEMIAVIRRTCS